MTGRRRCQSIATGMTIAAVSAFLAWCAPAFAAGGDHHHHRHHHHRHHRAHHPKPGPADQIAPGLPVSLSGPGNGLASPLSPQTWENGSALIAVGNVPGCVSAGTDPVPYLQRYGAQILRLVVSPDIAAESAALSCVIDAVSAGYRLSLVIEYGNDWGTSEVLQYFEGILDMYGSYAWAISIGNEQELNRDGWQTGAQYAAIWRAVEPVVAAEYPQAIRVAGEISPWGMQFIQSALAIGLPGAEAVAGHPYARPHGFAPVDFAGLAQEYGLQVWYSEGLAAQDSWGPSIPLALMPDAAMAGIWLN